MAKKFRSPPAPSHLSKEGKKFFRQICRELNSLGLFERWLAPAVANAAETYELKLDAWEKVKKHGATTVQKGGKITVIRKDGTKEERDTFQTYSSAFYKQWIELNRNLDRQLEDLGLTPPGRKKLLGDAKPPDATDISDMMDEDLAEQIVDLGSE